MKIDTYFTPDIHEKENQFLNSIVLMIDVLRSGTTICAALFNGAKEIIPCESLDKAVDIYSSLSRENRILGGERNGLKPSGFDYGNSPAEYSVENIKGKTLILTTSNGTQIFQKAKDAKVKIIGGFVNSTIIKEYLKNIILIESTANSNISFLCSGNNGRLSYEDTICAGLFIDFFKTNYNGVELTDSAHVAWQLYKIHEYDYHEFIKTRDHAKILKVIGMEKDIDIALTNDIFPVIPVISGISIKKSIENQ